MRDASARITLEEEEARRGKHCAHRLDSHVILPSICTVQVLYPRSARSFSSTSATEDEGGILHWWCIHPFVRVIDKATPVGRDLTILP